MSFFKEPDRISIQSIDYGDKKIEVYYVYGWNPIVPALSYINVGIFSKNEWRHRIKYARGNIFHTASDGWFGWEKINIRLIMSEGIPVLEVYCFRTSKRDTGRKEETIDGINVVYIEIKKEKEYEWTGFDTGWGRGSFESVLENVLHNYREHMDEVGAKNTDEYEKKAKTFLKNLNKAVYKGEVAGMSGVKRWERDGIYIDIDQDGNIISFGKLKSE